MRYINLSLVSTEHQFFPTLKIIVAINIQGEESQNGTDKQDVSFVVNYENPNKR